MGNTITYEQAVKHNQLKPIAEIYQAQIEEVLRYFAKNTLAQFTNMDLNLDFHEIYSYYREKDYSQFLFDKTEQMFEQFEIVKKEIDAVKPQFIEMVTKMNKSRELLAEIEKKIKEKEEGTK